MEELGHVKLGRRGCPVRILQLTDLHHFPLTASHFHQKQKGKMIRIPNDDDNVPSNTVSTLHSLIPYSTKNDVVLINQLLADMTTLQIEPDLIVLTGDIIDGRSFENSNDASRTPGGRPRAPRPPREIPVAI